MTRLTSLFMAAVAATLALSAVPAALAAEPTADAARASNTITFYGHVFGHTLDAPMPTNTQYPSGEDNYGIGSFDWCTPQGRADSGGGVEPGVDCDKDAQNKLALFSTAGFVQVSSGSEFNGGGGYKQLHNERGGAKDIILDTAGKVKASLYMSVDYHSWSVGGDPTGLGGATYCPYPNPQDTGCLYPYWGWDPGFVPQFQVKASLYYAILGDYGSAASDRPPVKEALQGGKATLVAEGTTAPMDDLNGIPGQPNVHKFDIDLGSPKVGAIPKEANFFLVYSFSVNAGGNAVSGQWWRIWSGEFFPPSFSMPVKNAFDVELVVPQFIHGKLAILGLMSTPWGSYDINPEATKLSIADASGKEVDPVHIEALADYAVAHGAHYKPVNVTFVWDYLADKLPAGTYTATIHGENHQRSATSECVGSFTVLANGVPGSVTVGQCGQATDAAKANAKGDNTKAAASGPHLAPLDVPTLGVRAVDAREVPVSPILFLVAFVAAALAIRRWRS